MNANEKQAPAPFPQNWLVRTACSIKRAVSLRMCLHPSPIRSSMIQSPLQYEIQAMYSGQIT